MFVVGQMEMCMPRALKMTPRKMASDLQTPWHNLARYCCAILRHSKFRLFLIFPSLVLWPEAPWGGGCYFTSLD